jgi:hypothetical protein
MVEGLYGTQGWMAPEIQEQSAFSLIRTDRWSRGKMLLLFLKKVVQRVNYNPLCRPSLVDRAEVTLMTLTSATHRVPIIIHLRGG